MYFLLFFQITIDALLPNRTGGIRHSSVVFFRIFVTPCPQRPQQYSRSGIPDSAIEYADGFVQQGRCCIQRRTVCTNWSVIIINILSYRYGTCRI